MFYLVKAAKYKNSAAIHGYNWNKSSLFGHVDTCQQNNF